MANLTGADPSSTYEFELLGGLGDPRSSTPLTTSKGTYPSPIILAGNYAIGISNHDGRRMNKDEIVAIQALESVKIALRLRRVAQILGLKGLIRSDCAIALRSLRNGDRAQDQADAKRADERSRSPCSSHCG